MILQFVPPPPQGPSPPHYLLGLKILNMLVSEMNNPTPGRSLTQHRKIAVSYRDTSLYKVGRGVQSVHSTA